MSDKQLDLIDRRQFIQRTAALVSLASLGISSSVAHCESVSDKKVRPGDRLSLAIWDGHRLMAADQIGRGQTDLCRTGAKITILGSHQSNSSIRAIDLHYLVRDNVTEQWLPHLAWTHQANGMSRSTNSMSVTTAGIRLAAHHHDTEIVYRLSLGDEEETPKLRIGVYVLAAGVNHWGMYQFQPNESQFQQGTLLQRTLGGFVSANVDYITLEVNSA